MHIFAQCDNHLKTMDFRSVFTLVCILILHSSATIAGHFTNQNDLETYIVHLEFPDDSFFSDSDDLYLWHQSFLPTTSTDSDHSSRIIYSYRHVFNGFAALLSADEVKMMEKKPGFVSARPQRVLQMHTTHSPDFLGLHQNVGLWNTSNSGEGVIIGLLDSGIAPRHPSFNDNGMPSPPAKWKGKCEFNLTVCNNKLIGARNFARSINLSPFDEEGHGTHTSSTAAGNFVEGANLLGRANGTASGIAPRAHVAMYKVCTSDGCQESDIVAGIDAAIGDGVDVLSVSLGAAPIPFYQDNIAIGAYSAIEKGIFVSCSAGNSGPFNATVSNSAPWLLTVGASTTDRKISAVAVLGNGQQYEGESVFQPSNFSRKLLPLIDGGSCELLAPIDVKGKIVLCDTSGVMYTRVQKGEQVKKAGGAAMILMNIKARGYTTFADVHVLPATLISYNDGQKILNYTKSASAPVATISFKGTRIGDKNAPTVAFFSSRGPSLVSQGILKPDIIGPGLNILAAWPTSVGEKTSSKSTFNIISGTSMSCPHLAGIAALLKSAHPDWSPAAIKSAIMTTADFVNLANNPIPDETLNPADLFSIGSGHVNPSKANDPGLVYDTQPEDYVPYLCGLNYTDDQVSAIVKKNVQCTSSIAEAELNYPSFSINLGSTAQTYTRTVTNVGEANSTYTVQVFGVKGVKLSIKPTTLKFSALNQKLSYNVTFKRSVSADSSQGYITWSSTKYSVRSPIAVFRSE